MIIFEKGGFKPIDRYGRLRYHKLTDLKFFIYFRHFCRKYAEPKRKKQNDVLLDYFDDNERFADFFNGILFQGRPEVRAEELEEASERYTQREKNGRRQIGAKKGEIEYRSRFRDLKKRMKDGGTLRILAMEAQELVDYSMPLRCMNYDVQE